MMAAEQRRKRGRPAHQPTDATRALVVAMVGQDRSVAAIAEALRLSEPTVRAHYAEELSVERPQISFPFVESGRERRARRNSERSGRPEHVPTVETRDRVEVLVAGGMHQWQIAAALGISVPTLCEHYAEQLENGSSRKKAEVLEALFKAATEGANVTAQKAWLAQPGGLEHDPPNRPPAKEAPMGKKEHAISAAFTAARGTDWDSLLPN
jgi:DNA-binding CsgD family transcriptional regulator